MMFSFECSYLCVRGKKKEAEIKGGKVLEDARGHTPKEDKGFDGKQLEKGGSVSSLR